MSLEIKVNPDAVNSLVEKARNVPNKRIDLAIKKLDDLEDTLSSWKGEGKSAHDDVCADLKSSFADAKNLMNGILAAFDKAIDDFSDLDEEISSKFEKAVNHYISN
ncbi:hypothetical protein KK120_02600 [Virgibacillus dakarensis]|nr:hypothetical protein [Virgibacillus dakarensis]